MESMESEEKKKMEKIVVYSNQYTVAVIHQVATNLLTVRVTQDGLRGSTVAKEFMQISLSICDRMTQ